jgi:Integrase core domain
MDGKVERFTQTLDREWAKTHSWPNHHTRDRALRSFLRYYNRAAPQQPRRPATDQPRS